MGIQFSHALENHEHFVCNSKEISHVHEQQIDCSFFHVQLNNSTVFNNNHFTLLKLIITDSVPEYFEKQNTDTHLFYKSSRGPPTFIA